MISKRIGAITIFCIICFIILKSISVQSQFMHSHDTYEYDYNKDTNLERGVISMAESKNFTTPVSKSSIDSNGELIVPDTKVGSITQLVNQEFILPSTYKPDDLVVPDILFNINHYEEKKLMRQEAADALEALFKGAKKDNLSLCGISGFRSYERQVAIYNKNLITKGATYTNQYSAKPGASEHQTGLTIDISTASIGNRLSEVFENTPEGKWLAKNACQYGFIIRYPKGKENITGYAYEPWHIRYVGKELAVYLYENELTLEEYYNYTPSEEISENYLTDKTHETEEIKPTEPVKTLIPRQPVSTPKTYVPSKQYPTKQPSSIKKEEIEMSDLPLQKKKPFKTQKQEDELDISEPTQDIEATSKPEATQDIEPTSKPEAIQDIEATSKPEATQDIEPTSKPEATQEIESTSEPEATQEIESTSEPEATQDIKSTSNPEPAQNIESAPEPEATPETISEPEPIQDKNIESEQNQNSTEQAEALQKEKNVEVDVIEE